MTDYLESTRIDYFEGSGYVGSRLKIDGVWSDVLQLQREDDQDVRLVGQDLRVDDDPPVELSGELRRGSEDIQRPGGDASSNRRDHEVRGLAESYEAILSRHDLSVSGMLSALLTADEVASILRITPETLSRWRSQGLGPRFVRFDRSVRYEVLEVDRWIKSHRSGS